MISTNSNAVKIVPITTNEEFLKMGEKWNILLQESQSNTIFLTWEWLAAWWKAYGKGKSLYILAVEKNGETIGLVPFYKKKISRFGFSFRSLAFLGDGSNDSDYLDLISRKGEEEMVLRSSVDFLFQNREEWDVIFLNEIPQTSPHYPLLRHISYQNGWYYEEREIPCAYINLPSNWDKYLRSLKPRMRTKIRSLVTQLGQNSKVCFDNCHQSDDLMPRLESLFNLHNQRWRKNGKEGVFVSQAKRFFYQEMSSFFLSQGWLRFYSMTIDNQYVAHQFCFEYQNRMFLLQEGYDPICADHGVGNVLRAHVLQDAIERKVAVYDFLGGITSHKLSWGSTVKKSFRIGLGFPTLKNRAFFGVPTAVAWGKKKLKNILPEAFLLKYKSVKNKNPLLKNE